LFRCFGPVCAEKAAAFGDTGIWHPLSDFKAASASQPRAGGVVGRCRECDNAVRRQRKHAAKEQAAAAAAGGVGTAGEVGEAAAAAAPSTAAAPVAAAPSTAAVPLRRPAVRPIRSAHYPALPPEDQRWIMPPAPVQSRPSPISPSRTHASRPSKSVPSANAHSHRDIMAAASAAGEAQVDVPPPILPVWIPPHTLGGWSATQ
jgi:hypothetical protein